MGVDEGSQATVDTSEGGTQTDTTLMLTDVQWMPIIGNPKKALPEDGSDSADGESSEASESQYSDDEDAMHEAESGQAAHDDEWHECQEEWHECQEVAENASNHPKGDVELFAVQEDYGRTEAKRSIIKKRAQGGVIKRYKMKKGITMDSGVGDNVMPLAWLTAKGYVHQQVLVAGYIM